ncbi:inhibitor of MCP methylation, CheC-like protein [Sulfurimonas gotlandica GD1]|uniref:Inhibitor of MCP methylation, CheC-like protein n=1 Tax=Sulfurimonas gotlandica (strain DSM 19862 / JCM 16533 / GD1) TaxID=929558 RepID=B6BGH8_SULGG|nr:chemotaxis protein CheC [Sulfurimonas gotlandica]EDZ63158.1 CheC, inhibitor of MCP methylation [Sulfurimonas gotlandica GD1]EHP29606.1 inhibitor of MCP methylation, CheC-like protein [Sulfurimonas gotlandica GD1]
MNNIIFNEDQTDALKEFMNIAIGQATSHVAELLDAFGTMHIPKISIQDMSELNQVVIDNIDKDSNYYVMKQLFAGKFGGECVFIISEDSASNLGAHLYDIEEPLKDDITDAVMELTNIVTSSIVSRLTEELNVQVQFFAPTSNFVNASNIIDDDEVTSYSKIIVVSTELEFKDYNICANIFILTKDEAIISLRDLIDKKIEELYS